jgi:N-acetylneuraminate synthase
MKAGDIFTKENLRSVRPGLGLPTKYYNVLLGKKIVRNAKAGQPMTWDLI